MSAGDDSPAAVAGVERTPLPMVNPMRRFALFTNAKCAGTTMKAWFVNSLDLEATGRHFAAMASAFGLRFAIAWRRRGGDLRRRPLSQILQNDEVLRAFVEFYRREYSRRVLGRLDGPEWLRVAVVRNPYDRLVSAFVDKFCADDRSLPWVQRVIAVAQKHGAEPGVLTFADFVDYLLRVDDDRCNAHWRRQTYILDRFAIDRFLKAETLRADLAELERHLGMPATQGALPRRQANHYAAGRDGEPRFCGDWTNLRLIRFREETGAFPPKTSFFDRDLREKVGQVYRRDFERLPYERLSDGDAGEGSAVERRV